jgi:hypothetical protein
LAVTIFWILTIGTTSITLADVQKSLHSKIWVLIQYNDGTEQWSNLQTKQSFYTYENKNNFYAGKRDHVEGLWRCYHSNWGEQIHEKPFTPRPYPQTPWEYAVGDWDDRGSRFITMATEQFRDSINGEEVIRFDSYNVGPLGLRAMVQQVWANPETRLPIRIRKYSGPEKFREGDFTFPKSGPSSIHDFGVSRDLEVVSNWGIDAIEPQALDIIEAAKQAWHSLPTEMSIVEMGWQSNTISVTYRLGNKLRKETYVPANYENIPSIAPPKDPEQLRQWVDENNLFLLNIIIFDGEYEYTYTLDVEMENFPDPTLHVKQYSTEEDWIDVLIPIRSQWPYVDHVGPVEVLEDEPGTPQGCILLRYGGKKFRMDCYVDPERDYICVQKFEWTKDKDTNQWIERKYFQAKRTDLNQLPSGQWYAKTVIDEKGDTAVEVDVKLLTDAEKDRLLELDNTTGFFSGQKLLKEAMDTQTKITFWAH